MMTNLILKNKRNFFRFQFVWSVLFAGIALVGFFFFCLNGLPFTIFHSSTLSDMLLIATVILICNGFISLTVLYIMFGKQHLPEWKPSDALASFGIMFASVPAMLLIVQLLIRLS